MKYKLMNYLVCPKDGASLKLYDFSNTKNGLNEEIEPGGKNGNYSQYLGDSRKEFGHIEQGFLICKNNPVHIYPIINGIPRMLSNALEEWYSRINPYVQKLPKKIKDIIEYRIHKNKSKLRYDLRHTQQSFSAEWNAIGWNDHAWGRNVYQRRKMFLQCFNIEYGDLKGKRILDAGCGHGEVEVSLIDSGAEIFAMDLSFSVDDLKDRLRGIPGWKNLDLHIIQGNVHQIPFREDAFDIVHSAGVLHHTYDTYKGFRHLSKKVRKGGFCFIEVYSLDHKNRIEILRKKFTDIFRIITVRLPHSGLHYFCYMLAPFHWLYVNLFNKITKECRYTRRSLKETALSLFDGFSPLYDWHHSTKEVVGWFEFMGYENIQKTFFNQSGIGIVGRMQRDKYRNG